jgi:hypothetical protein
LFLNSEIRLILFNQKNYNILKIIVSFILLFSYTQWASALSIMDRPAKNNKLFLTTGLQYGHFKDLVFSPLNYAIVGGDLDINFTHVFKNEALLDAGLSGQLGVAKSGVSRYNTSQRIMYDMYAGYLHLLGKGNNNGWFYMGGQLHTYVDFTSYQGAEAIAIFTLHSADISALWRKSVKGKHHFQIKVSVPFFGLLVRPAYTGWDKYIVERENNPLPVFFRGTWGSLNDYFSADLRVSYIHTWKPNWDLTGIFMFRYRNTTLVQRNVIASNQLNIGVIRKF